MDNGNERGYNESFYYSRTNSQNDSEIDDRQSPSEFPVMGILFALHEHTTVSHQVDIPQDDISREDVSQNEASNTSSTNSHFRDHTLLGGLRTEYRLQHIMTMQELSRIFNQSSRPRLQMQRGVDFDAIWPRNSLSDSTISTVPVPEEDPNIQSAYNPHDQIHQ
ncbi:hypothetical protein DSO57_1016810 [Entomophthora muscae]|uniref:Uncharacterized protein n=1 Tax=Entomophthora muscae TaxID=34485 RepID=A0ACC2TFQ6_9FUNG|nr:hypothetical protein DSO57_1016810 [Entomophthora muscae]